MEMNDVFAQTEILQYLLTFAAGALVLVVAGLIGMVGIKFTAKQMRDAAYYWRQYEPAIRAQVDQPTDKLPVLFDRALDRVLFADWDKLVSAFALAVIKIINERAKPEETIPPVEAAPQQKHIASVETRHE